MIIIDPEFQALCPPLSPEEAAQLEANLLAEGCRDALATWLAPAPPGEAPTTEILVDGHNRYHLCLKHGLKFDVMQIDCSTREEARRVAIPLASAGNRGRPISQSLGNSPRMVCRSSSARAG